MKRNRFLPIVLILAVMLIGLVLSRLVPGDKEPGENTSNWTSEHTVDSDGSKEENSKADNGKTWINGKNVKNSVNCGLTYDRIKAIEGSPLFLKRAAGAWSEDY